MRTTALLTAMEQPLGRTAGNAVEVEESVEVLAGGGPEDLVEVTLALAREMVELAGLDVDPADALADGRAMDRWRAIVAAQGGDPDAPLPVAAENEVLTGRRRRDRPAARRHGGRRGRLAPGRGPGPQGGRRQRHRRRHLPRQGGRPRSGRGHRCWSCGPTTRPASPRPREALTDAWTLGADPADSGPLILDRITPD